MSKPRILCLHGGGSNNDITPFQTKGLQLSSRMECIYLHAPHVMDYCYPGLGRFSDGPFYAWAVPSSNPLFLAAGVLLGKTFSDQEDQWDASLEYIAKFCMENGPFDGVYGFSQGTAIITDFSHPRIWRERFRMENCPWKFAILACGGASRNLTIPGDTVIDMPSFHMFGMKDWVLADSKKIANYWNPSRKVTHMHGRGHEIDVQMSRREKEMIFKLNDFLDEQRISKEACD